MSTERISWTSKDETHLYGVTRGVDGTTATAFASNASLCNATLLVFATDVALNPDPGYIDVGSERIWHEGLTQVGTVYHCDIATRGADGTTMYAHGPGAPVYDPIYNINNPATGTSVATYGVRSDTAYAGSALDRNTLDIYALKQLNEKKDALEYGQMIYTGLDVWQNATYGHMKSASFTCPATDTGIFTINLHRVTTQVASGNPILPSVVYSAWAARARILLSAEVTTEGYQVLLNLGYVPGMNADFSDIRFTDIADTALPYWIESSTANTSAVVWVKVTSGTTSILMYYGNAAATSESNGTNVFDLYDDFAGASIDAAVWDATTGVAVTGSAVSVTGANAYKLIHSKIQFGVGYAMRTRASVPQTMDTGLGWMVYPYGDPRVQVYYGTPTANAYNLRNYLDDSHVSGISMGNGWSGYHTYDLARIGTSAICNIDGTAYTNATNATSAALGVGLISYPTGAVVSAEYVCVRKCSATEPTCTVGESFQNDIENTPILLGSVDTLTDVYLGDSVKESFWDVRFRLSNATGTHLQHSLTSTATDTAVATVMITSPPTVGTLNLYYGSLWAVDYGTMFSTVGITSLSCATMLAGPASTYNINDRGIVNVNCGDIFTLEETDGATKAWMVSGLEYDQSAGKLTVTYGIVEETALEQMSRNSEAFDIANDIRIAPISGGVPVSPEPPEDLPLINGGFETGNLQGWQTGSEGSGTGSIGVLDYHPREGTYHADYNMDHDSGYMSLEQTVTLSSKTTLSMYVHLYSDTSPQSYFKIYINGAEVVSHHLEVPDIEGPSYSLVSADVSAYEGNNLISLRVYGPDNSVRVFLDEVTLE